jgi:DNA-binding transcriptional LysR family regulator
VPIGQVVAPWFLRFPITKELRYADHRAYTQCIIRDTTSDDANISYFVLPDSPNITVGDQYTKKEIIKQGMGWGHMPHFLIEEELRSG